MTRSRRTAGQAYAGYAPISVRRLDSNIWNAKACRRHLHAQLRINLNLPFIAFDPKRMVNARCKIVCSSRPDFSPQPRHQRSHSPDDSWSQGIVPPKPAPGWESHSRFQYSANRTQSKADRSRAENLSPPSRIFLSGTLAYNEVFGLSPRARSLTLSQPETELSLGRDYL